MVFTQTSLSKTAKFAILNVALAMGPIQRTAYYARIRCWFSKMGNANQSAMMDIMLQPQIFALSAALLA